MNKAIIIGRCGKDPETRYSTGGSAVTGISVATSEKWTDKATGEKKSRTEWHNITFFGRLAEVAGEYLTKGTQVCVEGRIQTDQWEDKQGNKRYTTKIIASSMEMLGGDYSRKQDDSGPPVPTDQGGDDGDIPF